ncbi:unnamed protein product [Amoebophrya sp. A120]|nr:unnamed protein product [Amoebophrya sp. A120]CAD7975881.1 unnamed protein product [Amoebophrya sp. A120]|eukprot:GSA120T00026251001.1
MSPRSGIAAGRERGHVTTVRTLKQKPSNMKGKLSSKVALVREVVRETAGFAPYERRVMELIKMGSASSLKRALKYAKKRLGTHKRGKKKREEMTEAIAAQRKKH